MKVLLVDDHTLVRNGIASLLAAHDIEVVDESSNGAEAIQKAREFKPDIILMDVKMPVCNGIEATRLIKAEMPEIKIVMLTVSEDDDDLFEAIKSGADGYLLKNLKAAEFIGLLNGVLRGEAAISPILARKIMDELARYSKKASSIGEQNDLTIRETDVLKLVVKGNANKEIASILNISENTVKFHLRNIMEKLCLRNRAQMVAHAMSKGLVGKSSAKQ